jgi:hypothetical protein
MSGKQGDWWIAGYKRRKLTAEQRAKEDAELVAFLVTLLNAGLHLYEIRFIARRRWGLSLGKIRPLLDRARRQMIDATGRAAEQLVLGSADFYLSIAEDPARPTTQRVQARHKLNKLLGFTWRELLRKAKEQKAAGAGESFSR